MSVRNEGNQATANSALPLLPVSGLRSWPHTGLSWRTSRNTHALTNRPGIPGPHHRYSLKASQGVTTYTCVRTTGQPANPATCCSGFPGVAPPRSPSLVCTEGLASYMMHELRQEETERIDARTRGFWGWLSTDRAKKPITRTLRL